jgi:autotransporter passenger strand-loop-strand repeat protein
MRAARPLLGEKPASGAVRVQVDGDNDSLKTYFMPAGGATSAMGPGLPCWPADPSGGFSPVSSPGAAIRLRRPAASPVARRSTAGCVEIIAGGTAAISSGGTMNVSSGGIASGTQINSNGLEVDFSGGTDFGATVSEGGNLFLSGGTSISASLVGSDTSGGGGRETVSSGGTALGTTLSASAQLRVSSGGVAISTTEIGTERAMRAAILPGRAGAIRVTSE